MKIENCSKREAVKTVERVMVEEKRALGIEVTRTDTVSMTFEADRELQSMIARLLEVKALSNSELSVLMKAACSLALEKWDPLKKAERAMKSVCENAPTTGDAASEVSEPPRPDEESCVMNSYEDRRRNGARMHRAHVPARIKHALRLRDGGKCVRCGSARRIEGDHIVPVALGGKTAIENMRLLCRSCNQRAAIETLGADKMGSYLKDPYHAYT